MPPLQFSVDVDGKMSDIQASCASSLIVEQMTATQILSAELLSLRQLTIPDSDCWVICVTDLTE